MSKCTLYAFFDIWNATKKWEEEKKKRRRRKEKYKMECLFCCSSLNAKNVRILTSCISLNFNENQSKGRALRWANIFPRRWQRIQTMAKYFFRFIFAMLTESFKCIKCIICTRFVVGYFWMVFFFVFHGFHIK